ncbi:hypothetical protein GIB67_000114 [Kingdonia uniflora]|uniref:Uncharacterized protein n=1 Tax=Kingdonia uniflora TaxID=39325 RepID=A0A7J7M605_9MAGN|nr:hypothetical protein GIB67_000114 [Kingdonia uniflora]
MALVLSLNEGLSIKLEIIESCDELMVDELDHISLRERLEMLIGSNGVSYYDVLERESKRLKIFPMLNDVAIKDEEAKHPLPVVFLRSIDVCLDGEGKDERFVQEQISADMVYSGSVHMCLQNASTCQYEGLLQDCTTQDAHTLSSVWSSPTFYSDVKTSVIGLENVNATIENSHEYPTLSASPVRVKVEYSDNDIINPYRDCTNASATDVVEACNFQNEIQDEPESDELDYISLKQRHRMLLSRGSRKTVERIHASGVFQLLKPAYVGDASFCGHLGFWLKRKFDGKERSISGIYHLEKKLYLLMEQMAIDVRDIVLSLSLKGNCCGFGGHWSTAVEEEVLDL